VTAGARGGPGIPRPGRRELVLGGLLGVAWLIVALSWAPPFLITCDPDVPRDVCLDTVSAGRARGLPAIHPPIGGAHVSAGPAFPTGYGHRATVTYTLIPGPSATVRLFTDAGGHWGGVSSHDALALAPWIVVPALLGAVGGVVLAIALGRRQRRSRPSADPDGHA
jgi:hypothetical protein